MNHENHILNMNINEYHNFFAICSQTLFLVIKYHMYLLESWYNYTLCSEKRFEPHGLQETLAK